ncbi:OadG family protein [Alteromonas ponticola]|uniref:Probable oxaloacetate decarboxylase gamma chain n=1 Tax=Alteromonas ponticola TaxID=2720613 RepID=A0ABX1R310_9ALTE|nr:OadG family transporter subunit [Alteromonas ponticola]NMH59590.1 oxaloacetate decarboxylase [Alteromonas ponticola]
MNSEAISSLLLEAATLLGMGMIFVFTFLALLIAAINLIAAFCRKFPGKPSPDGHSKPLKLSHSGSTDQPDGTTLAAISAAVHQYRKQHPLNVKE